MIPIFHLEKVARNLPSPKVVLITGKKYSVLVDRDATRDDTCGLTNQRLVVRIARFTIRFAIQ